LQHEWKGKGPRAEPYAKLTAREPTAILELGVMVNLMDIWVSIIMRLLKTVDSDGNCTLKVREEGDLEIASYWDGVIFCAPLKTA
jgi:hypothetical protein